VWRQFVAGRGVVLWRGHWFDASGKLPWREAEACRQLFIRRLEQVDVTTATETALETLARAYEAAKHHPGLVRVAAEQCRRFGKQPRRLARLASLLRQCDAYEAALRVTSDVDQTSDIALRTVRAAALCDVGQRVEALALLRGADGTFASAVVRRCEGELARGAKPRASRRVIGPRGSPSLPPPNFWDDNWNGPS
jgi:hypothetical protein